MRRLFRRIALINKKQAGSEGSLTLEAALTMPTVMICVLFLIYLIHASIVAMALQGALSQTARQTAAIWYPLSESMAEAGDAAGAGADAGAYTRWKERLAGPQETVGKLASYLPEPLSDWAERFASGDWYPDALLAKETLEPRVADRLSKSMLPASRMKLVRVDLPDARDPAKAYLTLEAEYKLPFSFPWSGRPLIVRASVRERVWTGRAACRGSSGARRRSGLARFRFARAIARSARAQSDLGFTGGTRCCSRSQGCLQKRPKSSEASGRGDGRRDRARLLDMARIGQHDAGRLGMGGLL